MTQTDVLIIGAGPTGLVLALWLTKLGVRVRIIDKTAKPGTTSRALAVQARTLELYRQIDLTEAVIAGGHRVPAVNLWVKGKSAARIAFGSVGSDLTPYPFLHIFPQDQHERLLIERLMHVIGRKPVDLPDYDLEVADRAITDVVKLQRIGAVSAFVPYRPDQARLSQAGQREHAEKVGLVEIDMQFTIQGGTGCVDIRDIEDLPISAAGKSGADRLAHDRTGTRPAPQCWIFWTLQWGTDNA
jgi:threonine dehydrogenase-like Zn-dependent dehydrogenase